MDGSSAPAIAIVGRGRLGTSLAAAIQRAEYSVNSLGRDEFTAPDSISGAELVVLTVPDREISSVAALLPGRAGQFVVHCSGALGREELASAEARGAITGCFHPLQTFPSRDPEADRFRDIAIGVEAPSPLGDILERLAVALGARPFRLEGVDRATYHAAAVVASNHLVALASAATRLWALAGLPEHSGRAALAPLITAAATNVASMDLAEALTGPVARGDVETVARHLTALEAAPELRELYRRLSLELLRLPLAIHPSRLAQLHNLLGVPGDNDR